MDKVTAHPQAAHGEPVDTTAADRGADRPDLVLCATTGPLVAAWSELAREHEAITVHAGSILDVSADAVVSPANSFGWMRGGVDGLYARSFPGIEERVRSAILGYHGGELPIGEALLIPTGVAAPRWLISAPTMREPGEQLPSGTVHPFLAARAVFRLWAHGRLEDGTPVRTAVRTIAVPGLGTGVGGVPARACAEQVKAAWNEAFDNPLQTASRHTR
jgi:O-acetyl-ADP-ribose deacetylase (regulator of RNase III)